MRDEAGESDMTHGTENNKRAEVVPISKAKTMQAELSAMRDAEIPSRQDDRDAAIISAMIGAARDWH